MWMPAQASKISNPLFESYEFARSQFGANDQVLDIACGDGYGCRILSDQCRQVLGIDINEPLIADNNQQQRSPNNIRYAVDNAFALSLADGVRHRRHRHGADRASAGGPGGHRS